MSAIISNGALSRFSRRSLLGTVLVGSTATELFADTNANSRTVRQPLELVSPKDAFVTDLFVRSGSIVKAGDKVCQLDTEAEDRAMERVALAQALLALEDAKLTDANVASRRKVLEIAKEVADAYERFASEKVAKEQMDFSLGLTLTIFITQASAAQAKAQAEVEKSMIALQRFDFAIQQLKQKQSLLEDQLKKEQARINAEKARLTIVAPVDGTISLLTAKDCFVKTGHAIAGIAQ